MDTIFRKIKRAIHRRVKWPLIRAENRAMQRGDWARASLWRRVHHWLKQGWGNS